jgi:hypothetical protein
MSKAIAGIVGGGSPKAIKAPKPAPLPPVQKPTPMPDEEAIRKSKLKEAAMRRRGGRADTILTDGDDLGG